MCGGYAADDGVALHFLGTHLERAVSSRPDGCAYLVEKDGRRVRERSLDVVYLGDGGIPVAEQREVERPASALGTSAPAPRRATAQPVAA
jgi:hypothetical protein